MPSFTDHDKKTVEYAEESELLEFANRVRAAGGGDPIEGFFPSRRQEINSCLIARALNFGCEVDKENVSDDPDSINDAWVMTVAGMPESQLEALAEAVGCRVSPLNPHGIILPERIGNTAEAFDNEIGWTVKYDEEKVVADALDKAEKLAVDALAGAVA